MLREFKHVKQEPGPGRRRWWGGDGFEFTVWYDERDDFSGFQLCYRNIAFTWQATGYWSHVTVGAGIEDTARSHAFACPILQANGAPGYPSKRLIRDFERVSESSVGEQIRELVTSVLSICAR